MVIRRVYVVPKYRNFPEGDQLEVPRHRVRYIRTWLFFFGELCQRIFVVFNLADHPATIQSFLGVFFGFFILSSYSRDIQGISYTQSLNLLLVLNGSGFISRMLPSLLARYFGTLNIFLRLLFRSSLSMFTWIAVSTTPGLYAWTIYYSLVIGGVQSLFVATVSSFTLDLQKLGSWMGILFGVIGFGALIGSPISGVLISEMNGSYLRGQVFGGSCLAAGCMFVLAAREFRRRRMHYALAAKMWDSRRTCLHREVMTIKLDKQGVSLA